jgi:alpha-L-rhamnosidase
LSEPPRPDHLRVEHLATAFGIDTTRPRLSWWLPDGAGQQSGYRIRAGNGWDSGRVLGDQSVLVGYGGPPLRSGERVSWQVKVWTEQGESEWSAPGWFELGLLGPGDWSVRWITPAESGPSPAGQRPAMFVRGEFGLGQPVVRGRLYATAHGIYEAFLNGVRVGDAELTPASPNTAGACRCRSTTSPPCCDAGATPSARSCPTAGSAARWGCRAPTTSGARSWVSSPR